MHDGILWGNYEDADRLRARSAYLSVKLPRTPVLRNEPHYPFYVGLASFAEKVRPFRMNFGSPRIVFGLAGILFFCGIGRTVVNGAQTSTIVEAQLIFPDVYKTPVSPCVFLNMPLEAEFTWTGKNALTLGLYVQNGRISVGPSVDVAVKDEQGNSLATYSFASLPPPPAGNVQLQPGGHLRIDLYVWNGTATIPREGWYSVQATLHVTDSAKNEVEIRTNEKRVHFILGPSG